MIFSRNQFFLLLFFIFISPLYIYKLAWLAGSKQTTGIMEFVGHGNLGSALGISTYPVMKFVVGKDTIHFNGNMDYKMLPEDFVPVRYRQHNPSDAKMNTFICIWGDTLVYSIGPVLVLLVLYLTPDRFESLIPKRSSVIIGKRPFIRIISGKGTSRQ
jgi:hypothetical protein